MKSLNLRQTNLKQIMVVLVVLAAVVGLGMLGRNYYSNYQADRSRFNESLYAEDVTNSSGKVLAGLPIAGDLPYATLTYRVDYGASRSNPESGSQAIYVTSVSEADKQAAVAWLSSKGVDLAKYEIVYQTQ